MSHIRPTTTRFRNVRPACHRKGAYVVEFAVTAPVLFLTMFAGLELSRYLFVRHSLDQAAFEAARVGVTIGSTKAQAESAARSVLASVGVFDATLDITPQTFDSSTMEVTVQVSCSFARNSWLPPRIFGTTPMASSVTLDHENKAYLSTSANVGNNNGQPNQTF